MCTALIYMLIIYAMKLLWSVYVLVYSVYKNVKQMRVVFIFPFQKGYADIVNDVIVLVLMLIV